MSRQTETKARVGFKAGVKDSSFPSLSLPGFKKKYKLFKNKQRNINYSKINCGGIFYVHREQSTKSNSNNSTNSKSNRSHKKKKKTASYRRTYKKQKNNYHKDKYTI